ncbi:hypothetical protein [Haloferula sp. BvORR071]|uniref:hypothetical protein n=1 Tax=Haloferula sp. BvORR071 TaxID=1396141 RepID=UPI002240FECB|nr:hypothetical protein [Haloferula sp. BvORR071]
MKNVPENSLPEQTIKNTMRGNRIRAALCEQTLEILMKLTSHNEVALAPPL